MQVNILEAKNQLSQLLRRAQAGEEIIIAKRGQPVARLVPVNPVKSAVARCNPSAAGIAKWLAAHPLPAHARRSGDATDADIAQERRAWD